MTLEAPALARRRRTFIQAFLGIVLIAVVVSGASYLRSERFHQRVRYKLISELERITGARVEIQSFQWNLSKLEFDARDVTLHGLEGPDDLPYAHAGRLFVRLKILSLFQREIGMRYVGVERPVIHLIVFPDGSTNQPVPKVKIESNKSPVDRLFELAVEKLEITEGLLVLNDRRLPFSFSGSGVSAGMTYELLSQRYDGVIHIGRIDSKYKDFRPLRSNVEVRFSLARAQAELKSLKWASARSNFEASGSMVNFNDPRIDVSYNATLDLAELGSVARVAELRSGKLVLNGQGSYTTAEFATAGKVFLRNLTWQQPGLDVAGVAAAANFSLTRDRLSLSAVQGRALGGAFTGSADVRHWSRAAEKTGAKTKPTAGEAQQGSAYLAVSGIQTEALAAALSTPRLPLARIRPAGSVNGKIDFRWTGSPNLADAAIALDATPPAAPAPAQLPVSARLRAAYHSASNILQVTELDLVTRATRLNASGALGSDRTLLNVAIHSTNFGEFDPALAAFRRPDLPVDVSGRASFVGRVSGKLATPAVAGHLEVTDFDTTITFPQAGAQQPQKVAAKPGVPSANAPAAQPVSVAKKIHWDLLSADVAYSPALVEVRNGFLRRGAAQVDFGGSARLRNGAFDQNTPFTARVQVRDADVSDLQNLAGYDYPVTGTLSGNIELAGKQTDATGTGAFQLTGGAIYGEPFQSLRSSIRVAGREARFDDIVFAHNGARITGTAAYGLDGKTFRFGLRGTAFNLAGVRQLQSQRFTAQGMAAFTAEGSGTVEEPVMNAHLELTGLVLNGKAVGRIVADAVTRDEDMQLTARLYSGDAELALGGSIRLRGDFPADLRLRFARVDIDPLLRAFLPGRVTGHSAVAGSATLKGPLRMPRLLDVQGVLDQFSAEIEKLAVRSAGPIRFAMAGQTVRVQPFRLVGEDTNLSASGSISLTGDRAIAARADGNLNLKLLQTFNPDLLSYGQTTLALSIAGTVARPQMAGEVQIAKAGISLIDLPNGLSDINGTLSFNENRLQVDSLTARTGGGMLRVGGFISYANGLYFNLTATSDDIRLRYPPGISAMADADLRFVGTTANSLLSGDVTITRFGLNPRFDFALYLARSKQPPTIPKPNSPLNNLRFDVRIVSTPELQVETSLAKVSGNADLRLRGTAAHPVVLGRVNVVQGDVFFNGTKYHLERGDITFTNPVRIEPVFNVEATARVRQYDITLGFHGTIDKLSATYRSDPPLPTGDVIALLALGRTREESALQRQSASAFTETASNAILGQALNATISNRAQKLFGISKIKIDPQVGGPESNPNARVTIEQQVSDKVTLTYITNLAQSAQQIVQVEFNINRNFYIVAVRDQNGVVGFDFKYRQRKR